MSATSPLVFRPSLAQRTLSALLCAGSWLVGVRGLYLLINNLPRLMAAERQASLAGEPTLLLWVWIVASVTLCLVAGILLLFSALGLILIEGTQIMVDEAGITVEHAGLPRPLAIRLGAGHLPWKHVLGLEKGKVFFILRGGLPKGEPSNLLTERYAKVHLEVPAGGPAGAADPDHPGAQLQPDLSYTIGADFYIPKASSQLSLAPHGATSRPLEPSRSDTLEATPIGASCA